MNHYSVLKLKIDDRVYAMHQMSPIDAAPFGLRVTKAFSKLIASPSAVELMNSLKGIIGNDKPIEKATENIEISGDSIKMVMSLMGLLSEIDPAEVAEIFRIAVCSKGSEVFANDNDALSDEGKFDTHFRNYASDYYPVAAWATWNHVKDFFVGIGGGMTALFQSLTPARTPMSTVQK